MSTQSLIHDKVYLLYLYNEPKKFIKKSQLVSYRHFVSGLKLKHIIFALICAKKSFFFFIYISIETYISRTHLFPYYYRLNFVCALVQDKMTSALMHPYNIYACLCKCVSTINHFSASLPR